MKCVIASFWLNPGRFCLDILSAERRFDINTVVAGIRVLTAFALALEEMVDAIEKRLMAWQPRAGETERL